MKNFENKIKSKLSDAVSNEGIDANDLWNSISSEIETAPSPTEKAVPSKSSPKRYWRLLTLFLIVVGLGFYFYQSSESTNTPVTKKEKEITSLDNSTSTPLKNNEQKNSEQKVKSTIDAVTSGALVTEEATSVELTTAAVIIDEAASDHVANVETASDIVTIEAAAANEDGTIDGTTSKLPTLNTNTPDLPKILSGSNNSTSSSSSAKINKNVAINTPLNAKVNTAQNTLSNSEKLNTEKQQALVNATATEHIDEEKTLPIVDQARQSSAAVLIENEKSPAAEAKVGLTPAANNPTLSNKATSLKKQGVAFGELVNITTKSVLTPLQEPTKEAESFANVSNLLDRKNAHFSFGVFAGSHIVQNRFSTEVVADEARSHLLNTAYHVQLGQQASAELNFHVNKKLYLSTGVAWQNSITQFDLVQHWDTVDVSVAPHPELLIDPRAVRTIRHHNKMTALSLPISIGYQRELGRWGLGAQAGVAFNFTQSQSGKTINALDQITVYPISDSASLPVADFFMSYHLQPYIYFKSSPKIAWQLRSDFRYQQYGDSTLFGLKHDGILTGLNFGIVIKP